MLSVLILRTAKVEGIIFLNKCWKKFLATFSFSSFPLLLLQKYISFLLSGYPAPTEQQNQLPSRHACQSKKKASKRSFRTAKNTGLDSPQVKFTMVWPL